MDFSKYSTEIKAIAIYFPQFVYINENYTFNVKRRKVLININNSKTLLNSHSKNKILKDKQKLKFNNLTRIIKNQVELAKNHGLYGFGIYYYWFSGIKLYEEPIKEFLNKEINFPFFIIWKNDKVEINLNDLNESIIIDQNYNNNTPIQLIKDIQKYLSCKKYIKINKKSVLGIYEPLAIPYLQNYLLKLRKFAIENKIGELYILRIFNEYDKKKYIKLFDGGFEYPPKNININKLIKNQKENFYYYISLIYIKKNINENYNISFPLYRGVMLECDIAHKNTNPIIFKEYSPEKLYFLTKKLIKWTKSNNNKNNYIIFINAWNNLKEGFYLEPNEKFGYASLNALSKALFNLPLRNNNYNLLNLKKDCKIAIQAHIFYKDLIIEIINKINNISVKFDLFISTISVEIKNIIIQYIKKYSKANKYEIIIVKNKGRDILPLLIQLKNKIKQYKYLCHIHTKKSKTNPQIGIIWRNYLYNNLLGNNIIISEILSDFENKDKLGFIFPETFYKLINQSFLLTKKNKKYMKYILKKLFSYNNIGNKLDFPAGNMFWARFDAIYQIFEYNFFNKFESEKDQTNDTIMHGIERIWLYLVKHNGFYYKKIFKSYI